MSSPNPPKITITGPFWEAQATILSGTNDGHKARYKRNIFVDEAIRISGDDRLHHPGTMRALCVVKSVTITPDASQSYQWRANTSGITVDTAAQIDTAKANGTVTLLLLGTDPTIPMDSPDKTYQCLNGEICLDAMRTAPGTIQNLYTALGLERDNTGEPIPGERWELSVHASGLSLHSMFQYPWMTKSLIAPLLLSPEIAPDGTVTDASYRLSIEKNRLTETEERNLILAWQKLSSYVNPRNPLVPGDGDAPTPLWVTLELANLLNVPDLYWKIENWSDPLPRELYAAGPEINVVFTDQQFYDQTFPPTSIASIIPHEILITGELSGLEFQLSMGLKVEEDVIGLTSVKYSWQAGDSEPTEKVTFSEAELAYSPVEIPQGLRAFQNQPTPVWNPDDNAVPIEHPIIWGFLPLDDGWFQAPFLNLSEQIMLDAQLVNFEEADAGKQDVQGLIRGAIGFGNTQQAALDARPGENPWNITIIDAGWFTGTWKLVPDGSDGLKLDDVAIELQATKMAISGLLWLSTGAPSLQDALPDLSDWIDGLETVPLYTHRPDKDLFPAPIYFKMSAMQVSARNGHTPEPRVRPSALLSDWTVEFQLETALIAALLEKKIITDDAFSRLNPLLWLRHRTLPMIQALPMTQSQLPANYPSASRQLVPFELPVAETTLTDGVSMVLPTAWRFGVVDGNGADQWMLPIVPATLTPAREWIAYADLTLVSLSIPGMLLDPLTTTALPPDTYLQLPLQARYDLPYSDQIYALAELPKPERDPQLSLPMPDDPPEEQPKPLTRADYADFWRDRSIKATLAQVAAAELFARQANALHIEHLIEPYIWKVKAQAMLDIYPGSLTLDNESGATLPLALEGESALEGISGAFSVDGSGDLTHVDPSTIDAVHVTAGSAAAFVQPMSNGNGGTAYRDQRGLKRAATMAIPANEPELLKTPIEFDKAIGQAVQAYHQVTLMAASVLEVNDSHWNFWFKDLPFVQSTGIFNRSETQSDQSQDINDPEALSREYGHLSAYEWRLGPGSEPKMTLFGLEFYPLSLERVALINDSIQEVEIIGRLQLPLNKDNPTELTDFSNAVKLTFTRVDAGSTLQLAAMSLESNIGEWPLFLKNNETTDAPLLTWGQVALDGDSLVISDVDLQFYLFDVQWSLALGEIAFGKTPEKRTLPTYNLQFDPDEPIVPRAITLTLDLLECHHNVAVEMFLQLGDRAIAEPLEPLRYDPALQLHYPFLEGDDPAVVGDVGINDWHFDMTIANPSNVEWLPEPDGGLRINQPTKIESDIPMGAVLDSLVQAGEYSIELWIKPKHHQSGALLAIGDSHSNFNLIIEQRRDELAVNIDTDARRARRRVTVETNNNALAGIGDALTQITVTMTTANVLTVYLNGEVLLTDNLPGGITEWQDFHLEFANFKGYHAWLGEIHGISIFNRAILQSEIQAHYDYVTVAPPIVDDRLRPAFSTQLRIELLQPDGATEPTGGLYLTIETANVFDDVPLVIPTLDVLYTKRALEFSWQDYDSATASDIQMLPGMHLNPPNESDSAVLPGFATCAFQVSKQINISLNDLPPADPASMRMFLQTGFAECNLVLSDGAVLQAIPDTENWFVVDGVQTYDVIRTTTGYRVRLSTPCFELTAAFLEMLINSRWGDFTQVNELDIGTTSRTALFGSSAGTLTLNYSSRWLDNKDSWSDIYVLNGMLEVTNLVSWSLDTQINNTTGILTMPTLPANQTIAPHTRHTIRILLNQHEIDPVTPIAADEDNLIFNFHPQHKWQFLAVVEHQLMDVVGSVDALTLETANYRRWTALQEVRLVRPDDFRLWLFGFTHTGVEQEQWIKTYSYLLPEVRELLANETAGYLQAANEPTLIVEASAPHWVNITPTGRVKGQTDLQYLPGGTQTAILSVADDFAPTSVRSPEWLLLPMPFLGRLQDKTLDLVDENATVNADTNPLQVDPILHLSHNGHAAPDMAFILSNFARNSAITFHISAFDTASGSTWARLDPLSLEENWIRLQKPLSKDEELRLLAQKRHNADDDVLGGVQGIMFALPDSPARLSRETALRTAFDSFRRIQVEANDDSGLPAIPLTTGEIIWRQGQIFVIQADSSTNTLPYSWHLVSLQLDFLTQIEQPEEPVIQRHAAATLLPVPMSPSNDNQHKLPISFAVSPYIGLGFAVARQLTPRYIFAELLSLNPSTHRMQVTASQFYDIEVFDECKRKAAVPPLDPPEDIDAAYREDAETILSGHAILWARQSHDRLAPDSAVAALRFRIINRNLDEENVQGAILNTRYAFAVIDDIFIAQNLTRHIFNLRSRVENLRFQQGQYGGAQMPTTVAHPFELAPPQVVGMQPVYMTEAPPHPAGSQPDEKEWDWGVSGLRVSVQYTENKKGVLGKATNGTESDLRIWWQAPQHYVQFRSQEDEENIGNPRPTAGLPALFRSQAIQSLMSVVPNAPMPRPSEIKLSLTEDELKELNQQPIMSHWQPILPGHLRYLLVGSRAGAPMAFRNKLLRQSSFDNIKNTSETLLSGSVLVQHRIPRPVPLPDNSNPLKSLQTWASRFEIGNNSHVTDTPADEAFFAASPTQLMRRLRVTLITPYGGVIPQDWDGQVIFEFEGSLDVKPDEIWQFTPENIKQIIRVEYLAGDSVLPYKADPEDLAVLSLDDVSSYEPSLPTDIGQTLNFANIWLTALQEGKINITDKSVTRVEPVNFMDTWQFKDAEGVNYVINKQGAGTDAQFRIYRQADRWKLRYRLEQSLDLFSSSSLASQNDQLALRVFVAYEAGNFDNFKQVLLLPMRNGNPERLTLPLKPRFVHFEDPEYNRRLASLAGTASREIPIYRLKEDMPQDKLLYTVTIASDRREYNPNSVVAFRYDWLGGIPFTAEDEAKAVPKAQVELWRISQEGAEDRLKTYYNVKIANLQQIALNELHDENDNLVEFIPGDVLELRLYVAGDVSSAVLETGDAPGGTPARVVAPAPSPSDKLSDVAEIKEQVTVLKLDIVKESVTPVTEAGYALLHAQMVGEALQVECARFAWSPSATRIELVNPDDLLQETVRRRAIYQWQISIRPERNSQIAIQKFTLTGSTYFPPFG